MAKIYSKEDGEIIAVRMTEEEELEIPVDEFAEMLEFDPDSNHDILSNYSQDHNNHSLLGGILTYNDVPYIINPPGEAWSAEINKEEARARFLLSQLAGKTPEEIYTLMQNRMDSWTTLAEARDDLREWLPLMVALIAWTIARE